MKRRRPSFASEVQPSRVQSSLTQLAVHGGDETPARLSLQFHPQTVVGSRGESLEAWRTTPGVYDGDSGSFLLTE